MDDALRTVVVAVGLFAGTNVDDLIVLTVLFLAARAIGRPRPGQVWLGQYAGIGVLVGVSAVAALGLVLIPDKWVGLLGLIPLGLGVRGLVTALRSRKAGGADEEPRAPVVATGAISVAGVTIANGADNIAVYTPLFRTAGLAASLVTVAVFAMLVAVWCAAGSWLGSHRRIVSVIERWGYWLVPGVFILLGLVIILEPILT